MPVWQLESDPTVQGSATHNTANSQNGAVTVTASGSAHTKGSWVTLIASTSAESSLLRLAVADTFVSAANTSCLMDVGIGAAASEIVVVDNLAVGYIGSGQLSQWHQFDLPLNIPAGTRIAVRMQSATASRTATVVASTFGGQSITGTALASGAIDTFGADTATSKGVTLTAGAANVKGAWAQIVASTTNPIHSLLAAQQAAAAVTVTATTHLIDIGVGGAGSEQVVVSNLYCVGNTSEWYSALLPSHTLPLSAQIPAGSRLSARQQCSSAANATIDLILYGVR